MVGLKFRSTHVEEKISLAADKITVFRFRTRVHDSAETPCRIPTPTPSETPAQEP